MIVVAILAIVAVLAVVSYGSYIRRAARSEVVAMLGEIRVKEEAFNTENGGYYGWAPNETTFDPSATGFNPKLPSTANTVWKPLGIAFPRSQLYCGYNTLAGSGGTGNGPAGAVGAALVPGGANPQTPWFYARGACDFDSTGTLSYFNIVYSSTIIQGF
jgi:type II secretory pathway pseudopilin PulG